MQEISLSIEDLVFYVYNMKYRSDKINNSINIWELHDEKSKALAAYADVYYRLQSVMQAYWHLTQLDMDVLEKMIEEFIGLDIESANRLFNLGRREPLF